MRVRVSTVLAVATALLVTSGCGALSRGADGAREFTEHFTTTYPDHVVDTRTAASNGLPFTGDTAGALVLADDTPPDVFADLLAEVTDWRPSSGASYSPEGVIANGVGVCLDDPQQDLMQQLRDGLYAEGLALRGAWECVMWQSADTSTYEGTFADLVADTAAVRGVLDPEHELVLSAQVSEPWGSVTGRWTAVPNTLEATLEAVAALHPVTTFRVEDDVLSVNVAESADLTEARAAADQAAAGELTVHVLQGSLDPADAEANEELLPVVQAVQGHPGVTSAVAVNRSVEVMTDDPAAFRPIHDTVMDHPDFPDGARLKIQLARPDGDRPANSSGYARTDASAADTHLDAFAAVLALPEVQEAGLVEPPAGEQAHLGLTLTVDFPEGLAALKAVLPDDILVTARGPEGYARVELTTARTLTEDHVHTIFTAPELEAIIEAWNAAP